MKKPDIFTWRGGVMLILALFIIFYNVSIAKKESFLNQKDSLVLALAPVDPRSLMQGDYMVLRFAIEDPVEAALDQDRSRRSLPRKGGRAVVVEQNGEYVFKRLDNGEELRPGERLLQYSFENNRLKIGGGAFFFQESLAPLYDYARYAQVSVDGKGKAIISGLLDKDKRLLSKKRWDAEQRKLLD